MKILDKAKNFYNEHKPAIKMAGVAIGSFIGGLTIQSIRFKIALQKVRNDFDDWNKKTLEDGTEVIYTGYDWDDAEENFNKEQEELHEKYSEDFKTLEEAVEKMSSPLEGKLWLIENGEISLVDGITFSGSEES